MNNYGVGGEYLYSTTAPTAPTEFPKSRTTQNDRKERPVSRQDSELYDMADNVPKLNVPTKEKEEKKQTKENAWNSFTTNCTKNCIGKRCIVVSILCAIAVIGVGAIIGAVVYSDSTTGILSKHSNIYTIAF